MSHATMHGAVLYGARDVRFEERAAPSIIEPTDAVITLSFTCICGSDLWPYRGISATNGLTPMGHEYCATSASRMASSCKAKNCSTPTSAFMAGPRRYVDTCPS